MIATEMTPKTASCARTARHQRGEGVGRALGRRGHRVVGVLGRRVEQQLHGDVQVQVVTGRGPVEQLAEAHQRVDRGHQVVAAGRERVKRGAQRVEVGEHGVLAACEQVLHRVAERGDLGQQRAELTGVLREQLQRRRELAERLHDQRLVLVQRRGHALHAVQRAADRVLVCVQVGDHLAQLDQGIAGVAGAAVQRGVQLTGDRLQLVQPAPVEDERQRRERVLDARRLAGARDRHHRAVGEHLAAGRRRGRCGHRHEVLAERRREPDLERRTDGQPELRLQVDRDVGLEVLRRDRLHLPDDDALQLDLGADREVADVGELGRDAIGGPRDAGRCGQRAQAQAAPGRERDGEHEGRGQPGAAHHFDPR
jgi:hypothetical protein